MIPITYMLTISKKYLLPLLCFIFLAVTPALAVSVTMSTPSASFDQNQELEIDVLLSCNNCADSYLRGVLYETGDSYFGLTLNNNQERVGVSSDRTKYYKVAKEELVESTWSGKIKLTVDRDNPFYKGPGNYSVKVGRYTASSGSSATWSDAYFVNITGPTPSQSPSPSPSSSPSPSPSLSPTPAPSKSVSPSHSPSPLPSISSTPSPQVDNVLGESVNLGTPELSPPSSQPQPSPSQIPQTKPPTFSNTKIGLGIALTGVLLLLVRLKLFP